ncbi:MAG: helix-turn-helix domain-containing protein [Flavobacteriaceae bacterium]|nr:helix-turn-helix domain-containing protein [Flavobacteriaceae bacterium]
MSNFYDNAEKILKRLDEQVALIAAYMKVGNKLNSTDLFFDNQEFMQIMNISKRTAQMWRDTGFIGYSQLGNKIYYTLADIQKLIKENYNPKKEL